MLCVSPPGKHISLVICIRGNTYHGETHITVTPEVVKEGRRSRARVVLPSPLSPAVSSRLCVIRSFASIHIMPKGILNATTNCFNLPSPLSLCTNHGR